MAFSVGLGPASTADVAGSRALACSLRTAFALAAGVLVDAVQLAGAVQYPGQTTTLFSPSDTVNTVCNTLSASELLAGMYGALPATTLSPTPSPSFLSGSSASSSANLRVLRRLQSTSSSSSSSSSTTAVVALALPAIPAAPTGAGLSLSLGFNVLMANLSAATSAAALLQGTPLAALAARSPLLASALSSALSALAVAQGGAPNSSTSGYSLSLATGSVAVVQLTVTRSVWGLLYDFLMRNVSSVVTGGVLLLLAFLAMALGPKDFTRALQRGLRGATSTLAELVLVAEGKKQLAEVAGAAWRALASGSVFQQGLGREEKNAARLAGWLAQRKRHAVRARARAWLRSLVREYAKGAKALHAWARSRGFGPDHWAEDSVAAAEGGAVVIGRRNSAVWTNTLSDVDDLMQSLRAAKGSLQVPAAAPAAAASTSSVSSPTSPFHGAPRGPSPNPRPHPAMQGSSISVDSPEGSSSPAAIPAPPTGPAPQRATAPLLRSSPHSLLLSPMGNLTDILHRSEALRSAAGVLDTLSKAKAAASSALAGLGRAGQPVQLAQPVQQPVLQAGGGRVVIPAAGAGAGAGATSKGSGSSSAASLAGGFGGSGGVSVVHSVHSSSHGMSSGSESEEGEETEVVIVHPHARTQPVIRTDGRSIIPEGHVIRREKRKGPRVPPPPKVLTRREREAAAAAAAAAAAGGASVAAAAAAPGAAPKGRGFRASAAGTRLELEEE